LNAARLADPALREAHARLSKWQSARLTRTYADLAQQSRYADAIVFFRSDLYGEADFARRDSDIARAAPVMQRMLPEKLLASVAGAIELNALSQELDRQLLTELPSQKTPFSVADYCKAYRRTGDRSLRERQIELIGEFGRTLDRYVQKPLIRAALVAMRHPARAAGLSVLQEFLERGFAAFRKMHGAAEFLGTIERREREIMDAIYSGDEAPFPDPMANADPNDLKP
jgi:hypothetical protein